MSEINDGYYESAILYFRREVLEGRLRKMPGNRRIREYALHLRLDNESDDQSFGNDESGMYSAIVDCFP